MIPEDALMPATKRNVTGVTTRNFEEKGLKCKLWEKVVKAKAIGSKESAVNVNEHMRVPVDSGASFSGFNSMEWFDAESMVEEGESGLKSATGQIMQSGGNANANEERCVHTKFG
jgi:hypothetical protein